MADEKKDGGKFNGKLLLAFIVIAIVVAYVYDFQLRPGTPVHVPEQYLANILFVCPVENATFYKISEIAAQGRDALRILLIFMTMMTAMLYFWKTYFAMLNEEVTPDTFKLPNFLLRATVVGLIIGMLAYYTPNHFRSVTVYGQNGLFVLCEKDSEGAMAVRADTVTTANRY